MATPCPITVTHVKFTPIEWKILKELYEAKPDSVERVELIKLIWGNGRVLPTRTIDVHISSIQKEISLYQRRKNRQRLRNRLSTCYSQPLLKARILKIGGRFFRPLFVPPSIITNKEINLDSVQDGYLVYS
jgi:hypothetical protein